ncbi:unnamed protein product [Moneuplotes crassus]|uniref:Uncharacterized protein n=1 Tax=Euplotes crassus TaxID=5936 RepID=A0AAD1XC55_EUPCR|nr:unnamed protein product [Moneuplotes crassus]
MGNNCCAAKRNEDNNLKKGDPQHYVQETPKEENKKKKKRVKKRKHTGIRAINVNKDNSKSSKYRINTMVPKRSEKIHQEDKSSDNLTNEISENLSSEEDDSFDEDNTNAPPLRQFKSQHPQSSVNQTKLDNSLGMGNKVISICSAMSSEIKNVRSSQKLKAKHFGDNGSFNGNTNKRKTKRSSMRYKDRRAEEKFTGTAIGLDTGIEFKKHVNRKTKKKNQYTMFDVINS